MIESPRKYGRFVLPEGVTVFGEITTLEMVRVLAHAPWVERAYTGQELPRKDLGFAFPVMPSKILCIGRNYPAHAKEVGETVPKAPLVFLKPPSSLLEPEGTVRLPHESRQVEHEAELVVVIGRRSKRVSVHNAMEHVFGLTIAADITARDLQRQDGQWTRAKGFDTFCPVGPFIVTGLNPGALRIIARVNGQERQNALTSDMVFSVPEIVSYLSQAMTLEPGDIILTGTPHGVGPVVDGDVLEVEVPSIGTLRVHVQQEPTTLE